MVGACLGGSGCSKSSELAFSLVAIAPTFGLSTLAFILFKPILQSVTDCSGTTQSYTRHGNEVTTRRGGELSNARRQRTAHSASASCGDDAKPPGSAAGKRLTTTKKEDIIIAASCGIFFAAVKSTNATTRRLDVTSHSD